MLFDERPNFPQGLKPKISFFSDGTAEAVPFQNSIYATSSSIASQKFPSKTLKAKCGIFGSPPPN
jgi:hypothetical protein